MPDIAQIVTGLRREANIDFISLPLIAGDVEYTLDIKDEKMILRRTLEVIEGLVMAGVFPGDFTLEAFHKDGFQFWSGTPEEFLKRIEDEWIAMGKTPTLFEPICWFALRSSPSK